MNGDADNHADPPSGDPAVTSADAAGDAVAGVVDEVRRDLAARRARGDMPELPANELDRQFSAVVEAVEAGIIEEPPLDPGDLTGPAVLETWRPMAGRSGPVARIAGVLLSPFTRIAGVFVRRQVGQFATRTAVVVEELATRQNRILFFLSRAHLDRQRRLEYRVAALEREVERLRSERAESSQHSDAGVGGN